MNRLRKETTSLHRYIKDTVLREFVESEQSVELEIIKDISYDNSFVYQALVDLEFQNSSDVGRGWLFFDCTNYDSNGYCVYSDNSCSPEFVVVSGTDASGDFCYGTPEQINRVTVYDEYLNTIPPENYVIDYIDCRIITSDELIVPKYVDFHWNYVSLVDEWTLVRVAKPPIVVIDINGITKEGYQLGGGSKNNPTVDLHIFAGSSSERTDLVDVIYNGLYLKSAPIYEFPTGDVLDYDGTFYGRKENSDRFTTLFSRNTLNELGITHGGIRFDNVTARNVRMPDMLTRDRNEIMLSGYNNFRAKISFDMISFDRY